MFQWTLLCQSNLPMSWLSPDLLQSQTTQLGNLGLLLSQTITIDSQVSLESFTHYLFIFIHQSGQDWRHWNPTYNMTSFYLALSHISGSSVMTYSPFPTTTRLTWWCFHPWPSIIFFCWRHFITSDILSDSLSSLAITSRVSWSFSWASTSSCSTFLYSFLCPGSHTPQVKLHDFIAATLCHFFISLSLRTLLNSLAWRWSFRFVPFWFLKQMGSSNQNSILCFLVGCVYFPIKMDKIVIVYLFPYLCMFSLLCSSRSGWARKSARLEPFPRFWQLFMAVIFLLEENPPY